ncbi:ABC transporter ATP-binding protein [Pilimelia terevasa]|uniref:ABC transporter ATP-binding protein n=1 Tax=Pilimelia terevasa TaxID=53372 RepID=UPI001666BA2B|nr:ABC transporter ATP-binding protein [Pilimelia terevasa]
MARPVRMRLLGALALQLVAAVAAVVPLVAAVELAAALLGAREGRHGAVAVAVAGAGLAVRVAAGAAASALAHRADGDLQWGLRRDLARHLGRLPLGWLTGQGAGRVKKAVIDDVGALHHAVAHASLDLVTAAAAPLVAGGYLVVTSPELAAALAVPIAVGLWLHRRATGLAAARMPQFQAATGRLNAATVEFVHGIAVVKAFGTTGQAPQAFRRAADDYAAFVRDWARQVTRPAAAAEAVLSAPVLLLVVFAAGTALLAAGRVDGVELMAFALLGPGLTAPLLALGYSREEIRAARAAALHLAELHARPPLAVSAPAPAPPPGPAPAVELRGVRFSYDGRHQALAGIDLRVAPGTLTALVGRSGSGKSTLAALVARFHDPDAGQVRIDGYDVRELTSTALYRRVGFVLQQTRLLRATVRDNIRLARPDADDAAVRAAARAAGIHDRVTALPAGYDTMLGQGVALSGGEAQRIGIARALLADPPILVLDEATAHIDPDAETAVQRAVGALVGGRTVLVVAHRLRTVVHADQIVVLADGRVAERGRHADLLAADGPYAALWRAQHPATPHVSGAAR